MIYNQNIELSILIFHAKKGSSPITLDIIKWLMMIALKVRKSTYNLPTAKTRISRLPTEILLTEDDAAQIRKMIQQHE